MGFITGFLGGITLTSSILYLTVALHQRNRLQQSIMLRQQSLILKDVIEPLPPSPPPTDREARVSVLESAKDRWNGEIEGLVKRTQETNWHEVRNRLEDRVAALWSKTFEKARETGEKPVGREG